MVLDFNKKKAEALLADHPALHAAIRRVRAEGTREAEEALRARFDAARAIFCRRETGEDSAELLAAPAPGGGGGGVLVAFTSMAALEEHFPEEWATEEEGWRANVGDLGQVCKEAAARGLSGVVLQGPGDLRIGLTGALMREVAGEAPVEKGQLLTPDGGTGFRRFPVPPAPELQQALRQALAGLTTIRQAWFLEGFRAHGPWQPSLVIRVADGVSPGTLPEQILRRISGLFPDEFPLTLSVLEAGTEPAAFEALSDLAEDLVEGDCP